MFARWGAAMSRFRWPVLMAAAAFTVLAGCWGTGVFGELAGSGFNQPGSESERIVERIEDEFGAQQSVDLVALYSSDDLTVSSPAFRRAVVATAARVEKRDEVAEVVTYYETKAPKLVSKDKHATYVAVRFADYLDKHTIFEIRQELRATGLTTQVGGPAAISKDVSARSSDDIVRAEMISMPVLLVLLVFVFGSLVAASTPLLIGSLAIIGAFTVVRLLTYVTDVSVFSINIITILSLGLAIDYALFMVSRFREELDRGRPVPEAVSATMGSAGRTVAVSGVTVALSLCGLLIFPHMFLRSMGLGGIAAVSVAVAVTLTVLPALLAVLGHRIDALRLPWARRHRVPSLTGLFARRAGAAMPHASGASPGSPQPAPAWQPGVSWQAGATTPGTAADAPGNSGAWARIAQVVMRRPALYAIGATTVLLLLAAPFAGAKFGGMDERALPEGTESRVVSERIRQEFPRGEVDPITVLVVGADDKALARLVHRIKDLSGVRDATLTAHKGHATIVTVSYRGESTSERAQGLVQDIRGLKKPAGAEVLVGGPTAELVDLLDGLAERLPWMALFVTVVTFVLLFLAFGSVVLPLKAIVMNVLSLGASFGAVVWVFQEGHFSGVLGFTPTGFLEATQPILMLALLFGLSMDYEVFLLSRVREQWDLLGDNTAAVASGVQRTGGIITAAALLLAVVVGAFATSGITFIKMIGLGMLVAILVDATLVRLLLVPATMRLMGSYNWWAPKPLRGLYARYGISESDDVAPVPASRPSVGVAPAPAWAPALARNLPALVTSAPTGRKEKAPALVLAAMVLLVFTLVGAAYLVWSTARESAPIAEYKPAPTANQVAQHNPPPKPKPRPSKKPAPRQPVAPGGGDGPDLPGGGPGGDGYNGKPGIGDPMPTMPG